MHFLCHKPHDIRIDYSPVSKIPKIINKNDNNIVIYICKQACSILFSYVHIFQTESMY